MRDDDRGTARRRRESGARGSSRRGGRTSGSARSPGRDRAPDATPDSAAAGPVDPGRTASPRTAAPTAPIPTALIPTAPIPTAARSGSSPVPGPVHTVDRAEIGRAAVEGAGRGAVAMIAGFATTVAIGLVLWAIGPGTDVGAEPAVRAATAAYVLGHFGRIGLDGATLTLAPLLLPLVFGLALAVGPGRARGRGISAAAEGVSVLTGAVAYATLVVVAAVTLSPPGIAVLGAAIGAFLLAAAALSLGLLRGGGAVRSLLADRLPVWATAGVVAGASAASTVVAGAGVVFAVALGRSFGTATDLASTLSSGGGDAVGLAVAGVAYLPNAVLATVGYVTGTGYAVGAGRYSLLGSVPADLPPFPLLAAVPGSSGVSAIGLVSLLVPLVAGLVAARVVLRRASGRRDRWSAVGTAAGVAGLLAGLLVWVASGGVSGGPWPFVGAVGWQVGLVLASVVAVVAGAWVGAAARGVASASGDGAEALGRDDDAPDGQAAADRDAGVDADPDAAVDAETDAAVDADPDGEVGARPDGDGDDGTDGTDPSQVVAGTDSEQDVSPGTAAAGPEEPARPDEPHL